MAEYAHEAEPELPVTPTNEGRDSDISNFGYKVAFPQLWPMIGGIFGSVILCWVFFLAKIQPFHWSVCVFLAPLPIVAAHVYLKRFVEGALPHTQEDKLAGWLCIRPEWSRRGAAILTLWPVWKRDLGIAVVPPWQGLRLHPLLRLRREFEIRRKTPGA